MNSEEQEQRIRQLTHLICNEKRPDEVVRLAAALNGLLQQRGAFRAEERSEKTTPDHTHLPPGSR